MGDGPCHATIQAVVLVFVSKAKIYWSGRFFCSGVLIWHFMDNILKLIITYHFLVDTHKMSKPSKIGWTVKLWSLPRGSISPLRSCLHKQRSEFHSAFLFCCFGAKSPCAGRVFHYLPAHPWHLPLKMIYFYRLLLNAVYQIGKELVFLSWAVATAVVVFYG